ncbi:transposase [Streptomyces sp. NPDC052101]|uniref:transposase n=1 Tax=Streptomyces sp. NPDC052101 TaxID=3155763 RepID=UPI00341DC802
MKQYSPELKADAVALCQSRPGVTIRQVATDLKTNPETLRTWVRAAGTSRPRDGGPDSRKTPPSWPSRT